MKLVSISGITCFVKDTAKTAEFYEKLGFIVTHKDEDMVTIRLNWFWMNFVATEKREYKAGTVSVGQHVYVTVDNVDEVYESLTAKGIEFTAEPQDYPSGKREAMVLDPDDYPIVFFTKKK